MAGGNPKPAITLLQQGMTSEPTDDLRLLLVRALGLDDQLDEAEQVLGDVSEGEKHRAAIKSLRAELGFMRQARDFPA